VCGDEQATIIRRYFTAKTRPWSDQGLEILIDELKFRDEVDEKE